jgi:hypothetical protein
VFGDSLPRPLDVKGLAKTPGLMDLVNVPTHFSRDLLDVKGSVVLFATTSSPPPQAGADAEGVSENLSFDLLDVKGLAMDPGFLDFEGLDLDSEPIQTCVDVEPLRHLMAACVG